MSGTLNYIELSKINENHLFLFEIVYTNDNEPEVGVVIAENIIRAISTLKASFEIDESEISVLESFSSIQALKNFILENKNSQSIFQVVVFEKDEDGNVETYEYNLVDVTEDDIAIRFKNTHYEVFPEEDIIEFVKESFHVLETDTYHRVIDEDYIQKYIKTT